MHQGRVVGRGLDCVGVVIHVARRLNLKVVEPAGYGRVPARGMLENAFDSHACVERVGIADMQPGDIPMLRFGRDHQHVGVFTGDTLIHGYEGVGFVCEHRIDEEWRSRISRVYRFIGVVP